MGEGKECSTKNKTVGNVHGLSTAITQETKRPWVAFSAPTALGDIMSTMGRRTATRQMLTEIPEHSITHRHCEHAFASL
jgi:hypothetical protein